jgi:hypothetical protein
MGNAFSAARPRPGFQPTAALKRAAPERRIYITPGKAPPSISRLCPVI